MSKIQRSSLAVFLIGVWCASEGVSPWVSAPAVVIGYVGWVSDDIGRRITLAFFTTIWCVGWVLRLGRKQSSEKFTP